MSDHDFYHALSLDKISDILPHCMESLSHYNHADTPKHFVDEENCFTRSYKIRWGQCLNVINSRKKALVFISFENK